MVPKRTKSEKSQDASLEPNNSDPDYFCGVHRSILEAFDNLGWYDNTPAKEEGPLEWLLPSESYAMKLIESRMVKFPTKEYNIPPISEKEVSLPTYLPGLQPNHQTCFPKKSVLTIKEQRMLFGFYCRMTLNNHRPLNEQELSEFQELRVKVAGEYAEFQEFAQSEWYKGQWKRTLMIPQEIEQYIEELWKMRAGQCLTCYPDDYKTHAQIPLAFNDPNQDYSIMEFVKHVHTQSLPPKMALPRVRKRYDLVSDFEDLSRIKPVSADINRPKPLTKTISAVSVDCDVDKLLMRDDLDIDVVISMSGIKTLIDNIKFQREWVLPVTVKNVIKSDGESVKKVVIIDKNLPPKAMSVHEKNLWHAKIVSKWMLVLNQFPNLLDKNREQSKAKGDNATSYSDMLNEVVEKLKMEESSGKIDRKDKAMPNRNMLNEVPAKQILEKSPESQIEKKVKQSKSSEHIVCHEKQNAAVSTRASYDQWSGFNKPQAESLQKSDLKTRIQGRKNLSYNDPFSDCVVADFEEFGVDPGPKRNIKTVEASQEKADCTKSFVKKSSDKKSTEVGASSGCRPRITIDWAGGSSTNGYERPVLKPTASKRQMQTPCLQYQIWRLHKSKSQQLLKVEQRSINLLVRTRKDGKLYYYRDGVGVLDDVCVSSKLEFQPEYGASKMAVSELIREYLDLFMRSSSRLVRVRSIGHTKEVMMTEVKTLSEIKDALQREGRQVQKLFDSLYAVLTKLIDLSPGRYMLQHTAKMESFATLLVEQQGWAGFNLPHYCGELNKVEVNVPPMPIDHLVLTPLQHRDRVAPALFMPQYYRENSIHFRKPKPMSVDEWKRDRKKKKNSRRLFLKKREQGKGKKETSKDNTSDDTWKEQYE